MIIIIYGGRKRWLDFEIFSVFERGRPSGTTTLNIYPSHNPKVLPKIPSPIWYAVRQEISWRNGPGFTSLV